MSTLSSVKEDAVEIGVLVVVGGIVLYLVGSQIGKALGVLGDYIGQAFKGFTDLLPTKTTATVFESAPIGQDTGESDPFFVAP